MDIRQRLEENPDAVADVVEATLLEIDAVAGSGSDISGKGCSCWK